MTQEQKDTVREALELVCEALELALARLGVCGHGDGADHRADADSFGGTTALSTGRQALAALSTIDSLAVATSEDVEGVVRDISNLCHTKAAVYFDWDMCIKIIQAHDDAIRRECNTSV